MSNDKIIAIETALSHHDRQIYDLSEMIAGQWREIERLKRLLEEAMIRIDDAGVPPAHAKPPHY